MNANSKYIVSIATATTTYPVTLAGLPETDCDVEPLVVDGGSGRTRVFDSWTGAAYAWKEARNQYRASFTAEGWSEIDDPYDDGESLRLTITRGGVRSDKVLTAMLVSIQAAEWDPARRIPRSR